MEAEDAAAAAAAAASSAAPFLSFAVVLGRLDALALASLPAAAAAEGGAAATPPPPLFARLRTFDTWLMAAAAHLVSQWWSLGLSVSECGAVRVCSAAQQEQCASVSVAVHSHVCATTFANGGSSTCVCVLLLPSSLLSFRVLCVGG